MAAAAEEPSFNVDVDAYLQRIGYTGSRATTVETLDNIALGHVASIPFDNVDVVLRREFHVNPRDCFNKLVRDKRGGYCFEHNCLIQAVLQALGFDARICYGRVVWMAPPGAPLGPRTHSVVVVRIDGEDRFLDAAFGPAAPACSLRLVPDLVQETPHEPHRVREIQTEGLPTYVHEVEGPPGKWVPIHHFDLAPTLPSDLEMHHWYTATHPQGPLYNNLIVTLAPRDGRRLIVFDKAFKIRFRGGAPPQEQAIASEAELFAILEEHFGLTFPLGTHFAVPKFE